MTPDHNARRVQDFETPQGRAQPLTWDDLPLWLRVAVWLACAISASILALIAGMLVLSVVASVAANIADPLAGMPY